MLAKVQSALSKLLAPGEPLLAGVSGGPDSAALLDALVKLGWRPHVCHLNHQLRGADSDADAEFVRALAQRYGLPGTIEAQSVAPDEDAARRARFSFFADVARRTGIATLALGHTADDQVETFLLRLLRGTGVPGLVGIWPERQIGPVRVIRPLLKIRREEILAYLAVENLAFREDRSNRDPRFARNRIRHELLPLLEREFNPAVREVLLRTGEILRDEDFYLTHHVMRTFYLAVCQNDAVNTQALASCPVAVQRRLVRFWLGGEDELGGARFSFDQIEAVRQLAAGAAPGAEVALPDDLVAYREYEWLKKAPRADLEPVPGQWPVQIDGPTVIAELKTRFVADVVPEFQRGGPAEECFDFEALGARPFIRTWRDGDRFQPLGMAGEKKLQDFFVDEKVPGRQRGRTPLLCAADGRIAWVVGHRIAEPFKITSQTRRILRVRAEPVLRQA